MAAELGKAEILRLADAYDHAFPQWARREEALGHQLRTERELGLEGLREIVEWKFVTLPGRITRTRNLLRVHSDTFIRSLTRQALALPLDQEAARIHDLRRIRGIGVSLASVILTFYDPEHYCIYDIHVMREVYGPEPRSMFVSSQHYLRLLRDLRARSQRLHLSVRTLEKALFQKNIERTHHRDASRRQLRDGVRAGGTAERR